MTKLIETCQTRRARGSCLLEAEEHLRRSTQLIQLQENTGAQIIRSLINKFAKSKGKDVSKCNVISHMRAHSKIIQKQILIPDGKLCHLGHVSGGKQ